ncbi:MAG: hypothetical protein JNL64_07675 [Blastocatellia bacterium]|nr:hypothetical protein [Blastocatellia bacterium]
MNRIIIAWIFVLTLSLAVFSQAEYTSLELKFSGNKEIPTADLKNAVLTCYGDYWKQPGDNLVRYLEHFGSKCSKDVLHSRGFWRSRINGVWIDKNAKALNVEISITEGLQYRVGELSVVGEDILSESEILSFLVLSKGDVPNGVKLQELLYDKLKEVYAERGYVQYSAEFEPEFIEPSEDKPDATVDITILVDEGKQFKVGRIEFKGVDETVSNELLKSLKIGAGEIYVPRKIKESIDLMNQEQRFRFIDNYQHVQILVDEESANVTIIIALKPH